MAYINFDREKLINLEYSLNKEILRTSRTGSYSSTTIVGCNTRKYHGLLVCPLDNFGGEMYVLLSSFDVSIAQNGQVFNIGIHKFDADHYSPRGHKYLTDFVADPIPSMFFEVGKVKVKQERVLAHEGDQLMIRYSLEEDSASATFQFRPLLAFRRTHDLTFANLQASTRVEPIKNGVRNKMYEGFPWLNMQFSKKAEFVVIPDWIKGIEYLREQERGYDFREDLFVPGFFELSLKPGESIVFSASTKEINPAGLKTRFTSETKVKIPRDSFRNCLINSAQQFITCRNNLSNVVAGYPWFGSWGRDTFIALPGLTLSVGDLKTCKAVLDTQIRKQVNGLFPNMGTDDDPAYNSVDAPLWFIRAVQQYIDAGGKDGWELYGDAVIKVIKAYSGGTMFNIGMRENGLIYAEADGKALTWMDAITADGPVTQRPGYTVEINALWYNSVCFALQQAQSAEDAGFVEEFSGLPETISNSFINMFWNSKMSYLADYVDAAGKQNMFVRPNMVIAASLPFGMLDNDQKKAVLDRVEGELLTPRGLRTLSPKNPAYKGVYRGDQKERDEAYHQGTVWPWLLGPFCEAWLRLYGKKGVKRVNDLIMQFNDVMTEHGVSSVSEVYDGDPPHMPGGTISQAWSVSELLRVLDITDQLSTGKEEVI